MNILLTGANGYIGSRLLQIFLAQGHHVYALIRNPNNFTLQHPLLTVIKLDLLTENKSNIPENIDIAYYLIHAMSYGKDFPSLEEKIICHFLQFLKKTSVKQIVYLGAMDNGSTLSAHFASRRKTEDAIKKSGIPYTVLKAGIVIGAGSASFEIIRDLVEKLPVMVAPKWINNPCQPIAVEDVLFYLEKVMLHPEVMNESLAIGGPDQLSYKEMLLEYANARRLKRWIAVVPVLTPRLSSYWLYFVTSVNFRLARALVDSLKSKSIFTDKRIQKIFPHQCLGYQESVAKALDVIEQHPLIPSWKDTLISEQLEAKLSRDAKIPTIGCLLDRQEVLSSLTKETIIDRVWNIGGKTGWYYMNWAWHLRGFVDKLFGGVGLQRGRGNGTALSPGYSLDFWRVILADKEKGHLLLYAEMKIPGEAWLEYRVEQKGSGSIIRQTASFRPKGIMGRLYWYILLPIHLLIFRGMARKIAKN
ncbi:putative protein YbjT [Chlamydiales bacterium STE3]|nr:putative protein YbjT [Chlamydiales bacterium STE3]